MESNILFTGVAILAICAVPIYFLSRGRKKTKQLLLAQIQKMAADVQGTVSLHEFSGDFIIGLDENNKYAFYYRKTAEETISETVNLKLYNQCRVISSYLSGNGQSSNKVLNRIDLVFSSTGPGLREIKFPFYNSMVSMQLSDELVTAEVWAKKIQMVIKL